MKSQIGSNTQSAEELKKDWAENPRWAGIKRDYTAEDVVRLRGSITEDSTLARRGAENLWDLLHTEKWVPALGALTGNQAVQQVKAGLKAIYLSGWQVAGDANLSGQTYPDQSLYPANSVPAVVRRINNALMRADQVERVEGAASIDWLAPIVADAEAGFGGPLNAYELMKSMIQAGAAGVHWEDQLASEKKCGHLGGKVLVPTQQHIRTLNAARLDAVITRGLAFAEYSDLIWVETGEPDIELARAFAKELHAKFPGKMLAYNCSPSFNWKRHLNDKQIATFQSDLAALGYKFQFITLAGFHALNHSMFNLAKGYKSRGMSAYVELQEAEFASEADGYTATKHQREVGTGYFDAISTALNPLSATLALAGSTENEQFH